MNAIGARDMKVLAADFAKLHDKTRPLILVNVWDAWSASDCEAAGHPAIATSSHSVAESLGYRDGQNVPLQSLLTVVEGVSRAVSVPVTVDFEAGFGETPQEVERSVGLVIDAGAVGINLEDGLSGGERVLSSVEQHCERIDRARSAANSRGVALFINARFDGVLLNKTQNDGLIDEAIMRGEAYRKAGADGLFVPGLTDVALITKLSSAVSSPLNVMMAPRGPSVPELTSAGVTRISLGGWPFEFTRRTFRQAVKEFARDSRSFFATTELVPKKS